jgi:hypothetical protein
VSDRSRHLAGAIALVVLVAGTSASAPASAQEGTVLTPRQRERERKAIAAFAATRYQQALDMFAELYADYHDPLYLRNIGRCHYMLHHPAEAIDSFEEYLRKYKRLTPEEAEEVRGWIREMRDLQKPAVAQPAPDTVPVPVKPAPPPVVTAPPVVKAPPVAKAPIALAEPRPAPPVARLTERTPRPVVDHPGLRHAGAGALIAGGALVIAGAVLDAMSWSRYNAAKNGACLSTSGGCDKAADSIDQHKTLSKIFYASGAALGVTGGALLLFFRAPRPGEVAVGASGGWTF